MAQHSNTTGLISQISPEDGKVYDVHDKAALHSSSEIAFSETDDTNFKHDMMTHVAENLHEYAMLTLEDGKYLNTDSEYGKILVTPLGVFLISRYSRSTLFPMLRLVKNTLEYPSVVLPIISSLSLTALEKSLSCT